MSAVSQFVAGAKSTVSGPKALGSLAVVVVVVVLALAALREWAPDYTPDGLSERYIN